VTYVKIAEKFEERLSKFVHIPKTVLPIYVQYLPLQLNLPTFAEIDFEHPLLKTIL
jgi:hypothetical protein